jgi:DnaK suppressor protein
MPAKKPAPKSAKGKKAASKPAAAKKAVLARKPPPEDRAKSVAPPQRKSGPASKKTASPPPPLTEETEESREMRKGARTTDKPATVQPVVVTESEPEIVVQPRDTAAALTEAASDDDSDALEPGSLLAGPRNVQPYIVKRGEQYMSKEQLDHFRQILNTWKRDLMVEVDRTVSHMKDEAANFPDPNDRATQEEEFSLELRTRDRERKLIRKIDDALKRIEDGSYGYCLETGEEIGIKRLEARPVATLSIEAQERRERRERQYGDRDDRYR